MKRSEEIKVHKSLLNKYKIQGQVSFVWFSGPRRSWNQMPGPGTTSRGSASRDMVSLPASSTQLGVLNAAFFILKNKQLVVSLEVND